MTYAAEAIVQTENAQKYATQLGKHWSHNLKVSEHGEDVHIVFPKNARGADWPGDALVVLAPQEGALRCRIEASAEGQRDGLKGAVERHVDRFAFREGALNYAWQDSVN
ncbi:DUF2218 domain-containing protein [Allopontixanthobacter sediminis]|uniref:DUF2218 domain-containing protein n=1 Tax=Allopontixanthobacter sediminis TaxID=1689985 RepID=A0A845BDX7_9SPHN|nr:DUF2218 domain-containing protein [Allopontixanthobacter sediminis]MXP45759.1 DUF2218 domain-containing protein [Allopontixanthobacter sediminis]